MGLTAFYFFTNSLLFNTIARWWEAETITLDKITTPFDVAILLGGHGDTNIEPKHDRYNLGTSGNRISQTLELYFQGKVKKIILTGGSGELNPKNLPESIEASAFLKRLGVKETDIILETKSRNTRENAVYTAEILSQDTLLQRALLITSAFHLPRAKACFDKVGVQYEPYGTDYWSEKPRWDLKFLLQPNVLVLFKWTQLIKEWVGIVVYKLVGYA